MKKYFLFVSFLFFIFSCSENESKTETKKIEQNWSIFDSEIDKAFNKIQIYVRLVGAIEEDELKKIAHQIKDDYEQYNKHYIFYLLPKMKKGSGAWAYTHFVPELEIEIMGVSTKENTVMEAAEVTGEILKKWKDDQPYVANIKFLVKEDGKLKMKTIYKDDSKNEEILKESKVSGKVKYTHGSKHGEYYMIESNGNLGYYSENGKFYEAKLIEK